MESNVNGLLDFLLNNKEQRNLIGEPDHVLHSAADLEVLAFVEEKAPKYLPPELDLFDAWHEEEQDRLNPQSQPVRTRPSIQPTIRQVYGYLALNNLKYGILTSFNGHLSEGSSPEEDNDNILIPTEQQTTLPTASDQSQCERSERDKFLGQVQPAQFSKSRTIPAMSP
ncbi:hypothetical protein HK102_006930 [Quaeritorhiza haematococci]|nr:hypothetical protein HK102_006930 [Quaeritorhiza haematococci]